MEASGVMEGVDVGRGDGVPVGTSVIVGIWVGDGRLERNVDADIGVEAEAGLHPTMAIKVIRMNDFIFMSLTPCIPLKSIRPLYP